MVTYSDMLERKANTAIDPARYKPLPFHSLDQTVITSRILRADELPLVEIEDGEPIVITAVGERQVAANGLTYVFERGEDDILLALFNVLFACRNTFPPPSTLRDTLWLRGSDIPQETRRLKYLVNTLCQRGPDSPVVYSTSLGGVGMKTRMDNALALEHARCDVLPLESDEQYVFDMQMRALRPHKRA